MYYFCVEKINLRTMRRIFFLFIHVFVFMSLGLGNLYAQAIKGNGVNTFLSHQKTEDEFLKNAFAERFCLYKTDGKDYISLLLKVDAANDLSFLRNYDAIVGSRQGRIVTLKLNTLDLERLSQDKNVIEVETARKAGAPLLNKARYDMHVQDVWDGLDLQEGYMGKDVIIGIADWGIDYTHPNFYDTLREEYRILAAWDQFRTEGPAPDGFSYGTLIEGQESLLAARCDTSNIYDSAYHATHVAGITGGNGAGTIFRGIAVEAQWIFCTWIPDETSILDAYTWMRDYARSKGKRLVINNSWGLYNFGYLDGTSMLDEFINTMSDNDSVVFVVSAGNNGEEKFHLRADFSNLENQNDSVRSEIGFGTSAVKNYWGETLTLQSENNANFVSKIEVYNSSWQKVHESEELISDGSVIGDTRFVLGQGDTVIYRASSRYPLDNRPLVDWEVRKTRLANDNTHVVLVVYSNNGIVHAWNVASLTTAVGNWGYDFKNTRPGFVLGDDEYSISEPAIAEKVITVGSTMIFQMGDPSEISYFSSHGPTIAPYLKPEIVAPGSNIISSVSSFSSDKLNYSVKVNWNDRQYIFYPLSGTSMSCPMVTGSIALMLQANPNLSPDEIKDILTQTADTTLYSGACPNDVWGYGTINTYQAVKMSEITSALEYVKSESVLTLFPVPVGDVVNFNQSVKGKISVFDMFSREVISADINGESLDVSSLKSGVYLMIVKEKNNIFKTKFIKK